MNKKSQLQFAHRTAILLEAGISLTETLEMIISIEHDKQNLTTLKQIEVGVKRGVSLSKSIISSGIIFDSSLLSMISFGESSGILAPSLRQACEMLEKGSSIKKKLIGALIYPAFIALATIAMTLFLVMYIFPKIIPLFSSMNIKLPLLTRIVQALYGLLISYGSWIMLISILSITIFTFFYRKRRFLRSATQLTLLKIPILGSIFQKYSISNSCRSIGTLLECGQTLPVIIDKVGASSYFEPYKKAWWQCHAGMLRGASLSVSLRQNQSIFPLIMPQMLAIGERTGSLAFMFRHVGEMYEEELEDFIKHLSTSIEPLLMIGMGLVVGSVALSIILPIYEITNHLSH